MPSRTAYARCPHAVFVRPDMAHYQEVSARVFEVFGHYTPFVEGVSIDEAFLDVTGSLHLFGGGSEAPVRLAEALRREIRETCSVGIAPNRLLAKIGSEQRKPDGLTVMPFEPEAVARFLATRPVRILWGIGPHTEAALRPYGLAVCGDIQRLSVERLAAVLGSAEAARTLRDFAFGRADDTVRTDDGEEKSVSREYTFPEDETDRERIRARLLRLVAEVGRRFRSSERWARTARIKLRDADFRTVTRQIRFDAPARDDFSFREKALALFDALLPPPGDRTGRPPSASPVRLIGFGVSDIQPFPDDGEPVLFASDADSRRKKRERLSETLDDLRNRGLL